MTQLAPRVPSIKESKPGAVLANLPGSLPRTTIARDVDHAAIAVSCIDNLKSLTLDTLADDAVWRDLWALTGTARTFYRPECMLPAWSELSISQRPKEFSLVPQSSKVVQLGEDFCWIQAGFVFECEGPPATTCSGIIGIVPDGHSGWKIWMLSTILEQLHGNLNPDVMPSMSEVHAAETNNSEEINFGCVIVGAGFSGLCVAGCLQAVGVRTITLEQNSCIGKNWLNRYHSARYHTSKYFSDFPHGGIFDDEYPYFLGIKDLACGYQEYVDRHKISVWLSSTVESAEYDAATTVWTLRLNRAGQKEVVKTSHVVIATGLGGNVPKMPQYRNRDLYKGTVLHSIDYKSARQWAGSSGIVVGAANTAHDIAEDMLEAKFKSVTMVQRGPTAIFPIEHYKSWSDRLYNDKVEIAKSDRETVGMPLVALRHMAMYMSRKNVDRDHQQFDNLERSGFKVERYGDLWQILTGSVSGHYMDVGGSAKIAAGLVSGIQSLSAWNRIADRRAV